MAGTSGYNFAAGTKIRSSQVNQNFEWFRGHYLPITQSGTWANTSAVYNLGSASYYWDTAFLGSAQLFNTGNSANSLYKNSIIKAYAHFIPSTTVNVLDYFAVSSFTLAATGIVTLTWTNPFATNTYCVVAGIHDPAYYVHFDTMNSTSVRCIVRDSAQAGINSVSVYVIAVGKQ